MVSRLISKLTNNSINVSLGYFKEPKLSENKKYYHNLTNLDFFNQIKISLGTKLSFRNGLWIYVGIGCIQSPNDYIRN